ncbi:hypothetical protein BDA99DRAFT_518912 [Phascolomyces articulosus]|uniref:Uncharacterized protein n=1 Tax=Phascolomyces articulosus TaxID=60185 RepID=A0AAD5K7S3_9FUNG|nr:hypothetical protein BDA99DRAFT_518912 [Phascolomyces articulosus]
MSKTKNNDQNKKQKKKEKALKEVMKTNKLLLEQLAILRQEVSDLRRVVQRTEPVGPVEPVILSISGSPSPFHKHTRFTVIPNDTKVIRSDHTKLSAVLEDIGNRFFENRPWDKAFLEGFAQELEKFANDVSRHVRRRFRVDKTIGWQSSPKEGRDLAVDMVEANIGDYFPLRSCKKSWATKFLLRRAWNRTCKEDANEGDILMNERYSHLVSKNILTL